MPNTKRIKALLGEIEAMKCSILGVEYDESLPFVVKTEKLELMRQALRQTEHYTLAFMEQELTRTKAS